MSETMYRVVYQMKFMYDDETTEKIADYFEYEEALEDYKDMIKYQTDIVRAADYEEEPFYLVKEESESNPGGNWHWCNLRNADGDIYNIRIEPINYMEARYFASEEIRHKFEALYGVTSFNFEDNEED